MTRYVPIAIATVGMLAAATGAVEHPSHGFRIAYALGVMFNAYVLGWCVRALPR